MLKVIGLVGILLCLRMMLPAAPAWDIQKYHEYLPGQPRLALCMDNLSSAYAPQFTCRVEGEPLIIAYGNGNRISTTLFMWRTAQVTVGEMLMQHPPVRHVVRYGREWNWIWQDYGYITSQGRDPLSYVHWMALS